MNNLHETAPQGQQV